MAAKGLLSWWWLPVISAIVWFGMLLAMLIYWLVDPNVKKYPSVEPGEFPYISDIGARALQPLFIAGCAVTAVTLDLSFAAERWLRHRGRLVPNTSKGEKALVILSIVFAIIGTIGLICLAIFDTVRHPNLHDIFLVLFLGGYMVSAVFVCWEYQRLGIKNRAYPVLRYSFWIKLAFILIELAMAIAFGVTMFRGKATSTAATDRVRLHNISAYLEWVIALVFTGYVLSFTFDLWPAIKTKSTSQRFNKATQPRAMEEATSDDGSLPTSAGYTNTTANF